MILSYPPPYMDKQTLAAHLSGKSEWWIDAAVKTGELPPPRRIRGTDMWEWEEVRKYLAPKGDGASESASPYTPEAIRANTERLLRAQRR